MTRWIDDILIYILQPSDRWHNDLPGVESWVFYVSSFPILPSRTKRRETWWIYNGRNRRCHDDPGLFMSLWEMELHNLISSSSLIFGSKIVHQRAKQNKKGWLWGFHFKETEDWVVGDGLIEVLAVVFAVVAEILCREQSAANRCQDSNSNSLAENPQETYDWILENCRSLMDIFQNRSGAVEGE